MGAPAAQSDLRYRVLVRFAAITAAVVTIGLGLASPLGAAHSPNVRGVLARGPAAVCPPDEPCDPPLFVTLVFSRNGRAAAQVKVRAGGTFALYLAPASYSVRLTPAPMGGQLSPTRFRVVSGHTVRLRLAVD
jgi:hypothetical protein